MNFKILILTFILLTVTPFILIAPFGLIIYFLIIMYYFIFSSKNIIINMHLDGQYFLEKHYLIDAKIISLVLISTTAFLLIGNFIEFQYVRRYTYFYNVLTTLYYFKVSFYYILKNKLDNNSYGFYNIIRVFISKPFPDSEENKERYSRFLTTLIFFQSLVIYLMHLDLGLDQH